MDDLIAKALEKYERVSFVRESDHYHEGPNKISASLWRQAGIIAVSVSADTPKEALEKALAAG